MWIPILVPIWNCFLKWRINRCKTLSKRLTYIKIGHFDDTFKSRSRSVMSNNIFICLRLSSERQEKRIKEKQLKSASIDNKAAQNPIIYYSDQTFSKKKLSKTFQISSSLPIYNLSMIQRGSSLHFITKQDLTLCLSDTISNFTLPNFDKFSN